MTTPEPYTLAELDAIEAKLRGERWQNLRADTLTPKEGLALCAMARAGLSDRERLDHVEEYLDSFEWFHSKGGEPEPVLTWFYGDGSSLVHGDHKTQAPTWREAIDKGRAECSGRASPTGGET